MKKSGSALPISSALILQAVQEHRLATRCRQKSIALDAGLQPNYLSMIKSGDRPSLDRVVGLKKALPDLDEHLLAATILCEQYPDPEAQQAIINLANYLGEPVGLEKELVEMIAALRESDEKSGLSFPKVLPPDIHDQIRDLLREAIQRETRDLMPV